METYYRYEGGPIWEGGTMFIYLIRFNVVKRTPKGAWIIQVESWKPKRRFVLDGDGKRYAYPTQEAALNSFRRRKESQISRLNIQLTCAKAALRRALEPGFAPGHFEDEAVAELGLSVY